MESKEARLWRCWQSTSVDESDEERKWRFGSERNRDFRNIEMATENPDARPSSWMYDVHGVDLFHIKAGRNSAVYSLRDVTDFQGFGSRAFRDCVKQNIRNLRL
jgi:hypothetical protein